MLRPPTAIRPLGIALTRAKRDFTDAELAVVDRARPFLIQSYRNAIECSALAAAAAAAGVGLPADPGTLAERLRQRGLTAREAEVLRWAATGRSTVQVAGELAISTRTVHKHLERAYRKLGVNSRADATALLWSLADERT